MGICSLAATGRTIEANVPFMNLHLREAMDRNTTTNTNQEKMQIQNLDICSPEVTGRIFEAYLPYISTSSSAKATSASE